MDSKQHRFLSALLGIVLDDLGMRADQLLVRADVRELVEVIRREAVDFARPQGISKNIGNGQLVPHNVPGRVLGKIRIDAAEPGLYNRLGHQFENRSKQSNLPRPVCNLKTESISLCDVLFVVRRAQKSTYVATENR